MKMSEFVKVCTKEKYVIAGVISKDEIILEMNIVSFGHFMVRDYLNHISKKEYDDDFVPAKGTHREPEFIKFNYKFGCGLKITPHDEETSWFVDEIDTKRVEKLLDKIFQLDMEFEPEVPLMFHQLDNDIIKVIHKNIVNIEKYCNSYCTFVNDIDDDFLEMEQSKNKTQEFEIEIGGK